ncbi:RagB/SusD family nutrient uptake outer membrane protein [Mucilaginibacter boryungensis]|uniref:RagB/SusD family nutrient uptake outer membrane protein n=1 Tax=Mucilaginibacter boryungensis TaxID=768480 RepID=A0ABR9XF96_9SPHI|nr:RagB/SusD family nutrient uptake outer membrane protein [Mucilaginibacter boryungensis]MBE9665728.1 RagB/SusD family nutrient uptake outer membrane protein [Mucilaginibacter boryungensis]
MKKLLMILGVCAVFAGCTKSTGFLENKTTALDETQVFTDSLRTIQFVNGIYAEGTAGSTDYAGIGFSFNKRRWETHGNWETSADDAEYSLSSATRPSVMLYQGTFSAANYGASPKATDIWATPYKNIRRCNLLFANIDRAPLSAATKNRLRGEATCLRVWYYMQLLIVYGGVPNIGDQVYGIDDFINLPRQNFADFVTYLSKELDRAATLLPTPGAAAPLGYQDLDFGRVTKGTAMGLKSRLLLYAASPLFNGGALATASDAQKTVVSYPTYNVSHWKDAADAAEAVINSGYYSLNVDNSKPGLGFYNVFLTRANSEYIFMVSRPNNKDFESYYLPGTRSGSNYSRPTQNIVDAFPMRNGKAITDPTSGYNPANPYFNRDPRFNFSIIFNGSKYQSNANIQDFVWTFTGTGSNGDAFSSGGNTGYFCRKMCDSTITNNVGASPARNWPLMRYAEILLNYAEAINETGRPDLAYSKLRDIRARAGILPGADNNYGMKAAMTTDEMRAFIQNERRIELAYEDQRWHDIRRWKIAMTLYNGGPNGYNKVMHPIRVGSAGSLTTGVGLTFTYQIENNIRQHVFRPEMYLLPIMDEEIRKMPAMVQNPGW